MSRPRIIGLTGGIGSGKSTVGRMVAALGVPLVDADQLAREVVAPGTPGLAAVAAAWPDVLGPDGQLDRKKLGAHVFADRAARSRLEAITHPLIQAAAQRRFDTLAAQGHDLIFYEASLLVEAGRAGEFDALVVVTADEEQQIARTMARDHASREQALARLRSQLPLAAKTRLATHLIDNSGDLAATRAQVEALIAGLRSLPPQGDHGVEGGGPPGR